MSEETISHGQPSQDMERWREAGRRGRELIEAKHRAASIKKVVQDRGIKKLYHLTQARNLDSIFEHGLLSRNELARRKIDAAVNSRLCCQELADTVSVYISGVNFEVLHTLEQHKRERGETSPGDTFVLLELDPSVLYELNCSFFPTGAVGGLFRIKWETSYGARALESMFEDGRPSPGGGYSRTKWDLKPWEVSDPNAEVFVFGAIPPRYIMRVFFKSEEQIDEYRSCVGDDRHIPYQIVSHEAVLFERRRDWIDWDISSMYAAVRKERAARRGGKNGGFRLVD